MTLTAYFRDLTEAMMAGNYAQVAAQFVYPFAICTPDTVHVVKSPRELMSMAESYAEALKAHKVGDVETHAHTIGLPQDDKQQVWLTAQFICRADPAVRNADITAFCRTLPDGARVIEMLEYRSSAFPDILPTYQTAVGA